jgi:hypothetical protein
VVCDFILGLSEVSGGNFSSFKDLKHYVGITEHFMHSSSRYCIIYGCRILFRDHYIFY